MTESEVNRAVQYVTASTSYGRETVAEVIRTGLAELTYWLPRPHFQLGERRSSSMSANGQSNELATLSRLSGRCWDMQAVG